MFKRVLVSDNFCATASNRFSWEFRATKGAKFDEFHGLRS